MPTINIVEHQLITDSNDWNEEYRESLEKVGFSGGSSDFMQIPKYLGIDRNFRALTFQDYYPNGYCFSGEKE